MTAQAIPTDLRSIREAPAPDSASGLHVHPGWAAALPWLTQGTTAGADMSLFGGSAAGAVTQRWLALRDELGCRALVHARQVHEADVIVHADVPAGILVAGNGDGHATDRSGTVLTVSVADCVPIFVVAPAVRAIALLHAGWRGVAAGILEQGIELLVERFGAGTDALLIHLGPAICGACFEVGPEVPAGLGLPPLTGRTRLDLRGVLWQRARACGVAEVNMTMSAFCTRCGNSPFFSHRGGCRERQLGVLGIRGHG